MNEIKTLDKKIQREVRLKEYQGADRIILAELKRKEIEEQKKFQQPFRAETGIPTLDACVDGFRKGQLVIISGPPKNGKCLGLGTKILMYDGYIKNVEKICIGDLLMGADSRPRKVLSLAQGKEMMYRVEQRGEPYIINESHILSLQMSGTKKRTPKVKGRIINISVRDYLKKSNTFKHHAKGWKTGVKWKTKKLLIDPYLFGLWLGDGKSAGAVIYNIDDEIISYLRKQGLVSEYIDKRTGCWSGRVSGLQINLRKIGVFNNKHIPHNYLTSSKQQRLELLAGLIDTDGSVTKNNGYHCYDFIQKSEKMSAQIVFLARSCGLMATCVKCIKTIKNKNFFGEYYRIRISGNLHTIPVKITRKKIIRKTIKDPLRTNIKLVKLGVDNYYGFELDGDGLFLLGDFTVTHNTGFAQTLTKRFTEQNHKCLWFSYELGYEELFEKFPMENLDFYIPNYMETGNLVWVEDRIIEAKQKHETDIVFIDHLDFLRDPEVLKGISMNLGAYVGSIVQKVKRIAIENNMLVFLLSHIRKNRWTTDELPTSEELADSRQIAQLADIVLMIIRKRAERKAMEVYDETKAFLGIMENRHNGKTKKIPIHLQDKLFVETDISKETPPLKEDWV